MDSKTDQYAQWLVDNQDKQGTEEFETVAAAYKESKSLDKGVSSVADWIKVSDSMPGSRLAEAYTPSHGASGTELALAGAGKSVADTGRGIQQIAGRDVDIPETDKDLMRTGAGRVGNLAGYTGQAALASFVPGANTVTGSALIGAGFGATQPVEEGESRLLNTTMGAGFGAMGQTVGSRLARALSGADDAARQVVTPRNQLISDSIDSGYTLPPSYAGGGLMPRMAEALSGKYKTNQLAGIRNQANTNQLASRALGLPDDTPLTADSLRQIRQAAVRNGYDPVKSAGRVETDDMFQEALDVAGIEIKDLADDFPALIDDEIGSLVSAVRQDSFDANSGLAAIKALREKAKAFYKNGEYQSGAAARDLAEAVEEQIERHLTSMGEDGVRLLENFRNARRQIAMTHSIEGSLNGISNIDAVALGRQLKRGSPLTAELEQIARFGQEFPDVARVPKSGDANPFTIMDMTTGSFGGGMLAASGSPLAAVMAGLPAARVGSRMAVLSRPMQQAISRKAGGLDQALSGEIPAITRTAATAALPAALSN